VDGIKKNWKPGVKKHGSAGGKLERLLIDSESDTRGPDE
jgi:hypothetical protein